MTATTKVRLMKDRGTGEHKDYAFVAFKTKQVTQKAIEEIHSKESKNNKVVNEIHGSSTKKNKEYQEKLHVVVLRAEEIIFSKANFEVCKKLGEEGARDIYTGEILSFSQKGPRGICILSANGAISNVTIRQPGSSGGILTYEACCRQQWHEKPNRWIECTSHLHGPDGQVIGGGVAGLLTASGPIQSGSYAPSNPANPYGIGLYGHGEGIAIGP
ncbi:hypothetical protein JHK82_039430 [Glycine max]|nr:hypothetical protein JHK82_039430 [Glycine max]KAG5121495.1 hypothetical protein JHK84_039835 [Glycine max]